MCPRADFRDGELRLGGQRGGQKRVHPVQAVARGILLELPQRFVQERQGLIGKGLQRAGKARCPHYLNGRDPKMRISTSRLALCCQPGPEAIWETPISARNRSKGSRSLRMSPLRIARCTSASMAP